MDVTYEAVVTKYQKRLVELLHVNIILESQVEALTEKVTQLSSDLELAAMNGNNKASVKEKSAT